MQHKLDNMTIQQYSGCFWPLLHCMEDSNISRATQNKGGGVWSRNVCVCFVCRMKVGWQKSLIFICVCIYVIYVCVYIYIYMCVYIYLYVCVYICYICVCVYIFICVCIYMLYMCVCIYIFICVCIYMLYMCVCIYIFICVYIYMLYMCVCVCVYICGILIPVNISLMKCGLPVEAPPSMVANICFEQTIHNLLPQNMENPCIV